MAKTNWNRSVNTTPQSPASSEYTSATVMDRTTDSVSGMSRNEENTVDMAAVTQPMTMKL